MILTERPRLQPRTLSPINEGQFFLQLDPAARLDPHSAFTIVAIHRCVQRRVKSGAAFAHAKDVPRLTRTLQRIVRPRETNSVRTYIDTAMLTLRCQQPE